MCLYQWDPKNSRKTIQRPTENVRRFGRPTEIVRICRFGPFTNDRNWIELNKLKNFVGFIKFFLLKKFGSRNFSKFPKFSYWGEGTRVGISIHSTNSGENSDKKNTYAFGELRTFSMSYPVIGEKGASKNLENHNILPPCEGTKRLTWMSGH